MPESNVNKDQKKKLNACCDACYGSHPPEKPFNEFEKYQTMSEPYRLHLLGSLLVVHRLDTLLDQLERGEKDRIDGARANHGDAEASIHMSLEELNLWDRDFFASGVQKRVSLVNTLGRIHGV